MPRKYGPHYLTEEKKKIAEENIDLVWWYMHKALEEGKFDADEFDEVSSYVLIQYCFACEYFIPGKQKLSTYAYNAFNSGLYRYRQLHERFYSRFTTTDYGKKNEDGEFSFNPPDQSEKKDIVQIIKLNKVIEESGLDINEQKVIHYKYLDNLNNVTNIAIGKKMGYTKERIRQIHNKAISKIKEYIEENKYIYEDLVDEM